MPDFHFWALVVWCWTLLGFASDQPTFPCGWTFLPWVPSVFFPERAVGSWLARVKWVGPSPAFREQGTNSGGNLACAPVPSHLNPSRRYPKSRKMFLGCVLEWQCHPTLSCHGCFSLIYHTTHRQTRSIALCVTRWLRASLGDSTRGALSTCLVHPQNRTETVLKGGPVQSRGKAPMDPPEPWIGLCFWEP